MPPMRSSKEISGSQPSAVRACDGSPTGGVASGGRTNAGSTRTWPAGSTPTWANAAVDEVADRAPDAAREHVVVGRLALDREELAAHDVLRRAPVAHGVHGAERELALQAERDRRGAAGHLARQEPLGPARGLVVERDRARRVQPAPGGRRRRADGRRASRPRTATTGASATSRAAATRLRPRTPRWRSPRPRASRCPRPPRAASPSRPRSRRASWPGPPRTRGRTSAPRGGTARRARPRRRGAGARPGRRGRRSRASRRPPPRRGWARRRSGRAPSPRPRGRRRRAALRGRSRPVR